MKLHSPRSAGFQTFRAPVSTGALRRSQACPLRNRRDSRFGNLRHLGVAALSVLLVFSTNAAQDSRFSDEPAPLQIDDFPKRPRPLIELGDRFLGTGNIQKGFKLPTGAVWHPSFWVYGNFRTAVQTFDNGTTRTTEWANDLSLFGNLQLAATERVVIGIRPLRNDNGQFTGYDFEPAGARGWREDFSENSFQLRTLFFEGEFGEVFPGLDKGDRRSLDYGISVGRQPLNLQGGMLASDDSIDMVTITRNALLPSFGSHMRVSGLFAWNEIERNDNLETGTSRMFGLNSFVDFPKSTVTVDALYAVTGNGSDGLYLGLGSVQRIGRINTTFRVIHSVAVENESAAVSDGTLLFAELSYEPPYTHNILYLNGYWGIDDFASAVRGPASGGPLGRTGILFAAVGLGNYGSALSNAASKSVGGALGYQMFFGELRRRQLILEVGGLSDTNNRGASAEAIGARWQRAFGRRTILRLDAFGALQENAREAFGARMEFLVKF